MPTHTRLALRVVATGYTIASVIASAGFGAVYAYRVGIQHSLALASLTILFAAAPEGVKPLAIAQAFQSFASWAPIRGIALAGLGLVAAAYSRRRHEGKLRGDVAWGLGRRAPQSIMVHSRHLTLELALENRLRDC